MKGRLTIRAVATLALLAGGAVSAHHSISMFELSMPVWVEGRVVSYVAINPHSLIVLDETTEDGSLRRWLIEGPSLQKLARMDIDTDYIQAGDELEVCGFPPKAEFSGQQESPRAVGYPSQAVHGHLLRKPDGQMRIWGSYGKLENCIRPDDRPEVWVDFLDSDAMARSAWCGSRSFASAASLAAEAFVDAVDRSMAAPCE